MNNNGYEIRAGMVSKLLLWICAISWMIVIYLFSSFEGEKSGNMSSGVTQTVVDMVYDDFENYSQEKQQSIFDNVHLSVRKLAHFLEYALLGFIYMALLTVYNRPKRYKWIVSTVLAGLYAMTDEFHQGFVADRGPAIFDVCIDTFGSLTGSICLMILIFVIKYSKLRAGTLKTK